MREILLWKKSIKNGSLGIVREMMCLSFFDAVRDTILLPSVLDFESRVGKSTGDFCSSLSLLVRDRSCVTFSDGPERLDAGRGARLQTQVRATRESHHSGDGGAVHPRREDASAAKVLESAMAALGPEDGATKAGLEAALRRVKEQDKAGVSLGRAPVPRERGSGCRNWK